MGTPQNRVSAAHLTERCGEEDGNAGARRLLSVASPKPRPNAPEGRVRATTREVGGGRVRRNDEKRGTTVRQEERNEAGDKERTARATATAT